MCTVCQSFGINLKHTGDDPGRGAVVERDFVRTGPTLERDTLFGRMELDRFVQESDTFSFGSFNGFHLGPETLVEQETAESAVDQLGFGAEHLPWNDFIDLTSGDLTARIIDHGGSDYFF